MGQVGFGRCACVGVCVCAFSGWGGYKSSLHAHSVEVQVDSLGRGSLVCSVGEIMIKTSEQGLSAVLGAHLEELFLRS